MPDRLIAAGAGIAFSGTAPDPLTISIAPGGPGTAFVFQQTTPSSEWSILHNLASVPASFQVLVGGIPVIADVLEYSNVRVVFAFGNASTGVATLLK